MALYTLNERELRIEVAPAKGHTGHGGQVAGAARCNRLDLGALGRAEPALHPRQDRTRGFAPEVMGAQLIVSFCCGGVSLADAERLQSEKGLKRALGVRRFADQTPRGEWRRDLGPEGVAALRRVQRDLARRALARCPAAAGRTDGELEGVFDDTQLEVTGAKIEGAALHDEGRRALGGQCLLVGPFLADPVLTGDHTPGSAHLPELLAANQSLGAGTPAHCYADSASREGPHLDRVRRSFSRWSISYNRWPEPPSSARTRQPESPYAGVRPQPRGCAQPPRYAGRRGRSHDAWFDHYACCACEEGTRTPQAVGDRHHLKGERERRFAPLLTDLDLHPPPCLSRGANQAFSTRAALAYPRLTALKGVERPAEHHGGRVRTLIRPRLTLPAKLSRPARGLVLRLDGPAGWLDWWRLWRERAGALT